MKDEDEEDRIMELLSSSEYSDRVQGLVSLDSYYRDRVWGYVRGWAGNTNVPLTSHDLEDVWQTVLIEMIKMLKKGPVKCHSSVGGLLTTIAYRRAVELLRKRIAHRECDLTDFDILQGRCDSNVDDLAADMRECFEHMSDKMKVVLLADTALYYRYGAWPSLYELCKKTQLPESVVRSRRARGRAQLRTCLKGKGYKPKGRGKDGEL